MRVGVIVFPGSNCDRDLNTGFGDEMDKSSLEDLRKDLAAIAGQAPVICKARISVSNFKVRQGMPVGLMVTLRGEVMWDFLFRLLAISLPNIRDFRGVSSRLDGHGNDLCECLHYVYDLLFHGG